MVDANKILSSLPSGIYEWNRESKTFSSVSIKAEIKGRKSVFCLSDEPSKHRNELPCPICHSGMQDNKCVWMDCPRYDSPPQNTAVITRALTGEIEIPTNPTAKE